MPAVLRRQAGAPSRGGPAAPRLAPTREPKTVAFTGAPPFALSSTGMRRQVRMRGQSRISAPHSKASSLRSASPAGATLCRANMPVTRARRCTEPCASDPGVRATDPRPPLPDTAPSAAGAAAAGGVRASGGGKASPAAGEAGAPAERARGFLVPPAPAVPFAAPAAAAVVAAPPLPATAAAARSGLTPAAACLAPMPGLPTACCCGATP